MSDQNPYQSPCQNPYNWRNPNPLIRIAREDLHTQLSKGLIRGESFAIFGGRGMGKSTFIWGLHEELGKTGLCESVRISETPAERTKKAAVDFLAFRLGLDTNPVGDVERLLRDRAEARPDRPHLILLFDNLDAWTDREASVTWAPTRRRYPE